MQEKEIGTLERLSCVQHATKKFVGAQRIAGCLDPVTPETVQQCEPMAVMVRCADSYVIRQMRDASPRLFINQVCRLRVWSFVSAKSWGSSWCRTARKSDKGSFRTMFSFPAHGSLKWTGEGYRLLVGGRVCLHGARHQPERVGA